MIERASECDGADDQSSSAPPGDGHRGLRTMRERAEALGGTVQIISAPGDGVCVRAELPLAPRP